MEKITSSSRKSEKIMNSRNFLPRYYTNVKINHDLASIWLSGYAFYMQINEYFIVFPEGDSQEIQYRLSLNQLVDINGNPLDLPLPTNKMIVFRVIKVRTNDHKGGSETYHYLEQVDARELLEYVEE